MSEHTQVSDRHLCNAGFVLDGGFLYDQMLKYAYYVITEELTLGATAIAKYLHEEPTYVRRQPRLTRQKFSKRAQSH